MTRSAKPPAFEPGDRVLIRDLNETGRVVKGFRFRDLRGLYDIFVVARSPDLFGVQREILRPAGGLEKAA